MTDDRSARNVRVLFGLVTLAGCGALVIGLLFTERMLTPFADHPHINPINVGYIHIIRVAYLILGAMLAALGILLPRIGGLREGLARHPRSVNLLLLALFVFYPCAILELALWAHPQLSTVETLKRSISYVPSAFTVHRMASADQTVLNLDLLHRTPIYFISNGYRARPFPVRKPPGEIRIFIVGGSHVFDGHAYGRTDWPTATEDRLHAMGFANVRVINAGTAGHRSFDALGRLVSEIHLYDPDYVVLCNTYNDLKFFPWVSPDQTLLKGIEPLPKPTHQHVGLLRRIVEHSQLYMRLSNAIVHFSGRGAPKIAGDLDVAPPVGGFERISPYALSQYKLQLQAFADICADAGIQPVFFTESRLVTLANYAEIERKGRYQTSTTLTARTMAEAYQACDSLLRLVAEEKHARFFDLARTVSGIEADFRDPIHLEPQGSAAVATSAAEYLATVLKQRGR